MADINPVQVVALTISDTVGALGPAANVSELGERDKTIAIEGGGLMRLWGCATEDGEYFPIMTLEASTPPKPRAVLTDYGKLKIDFAWAKIQRLTAGDSASAHLIGRPIPGGAQGPQGPGPSPGGLLTSVGLASTSYVFATTDTEFVVGGGHIVAGGDGIAADETDKSTYTIKAYNSVGTLLGTVGTFVVDDDYAVRTRVDFTTGAYLTIPANSTLEIVRTDAGAGATIGDGCFFKLTAAA